MNKILGFMLFVLVVASAASITFAYDPDVTNNGDSGVNPSGGGNFFAAGTDDDKQAQYDDVLAKKAVYDSVKQSDYPNDMKGYFNTLTDAWNNYVDALALYDDKTDSAALKAKLNESITTYINTYDELEGLYANATTQKNIYDQQILDGQNGVLDYNDAYFTSLRLNWANYLDALFKYDNTTDVDAWLFQLDESIREYQDAVKDIQDRLNNVNTMYDLYQDAFSKVFGEVTTKLLSSDDAVIDFTDFSEMITAWNNYIDALVKYDTSLIADDLKDLITPYIQSFIDESVTHEAT
jgi:hypothetical protein